MLRDQPFMRDDTFLGVCQALGDGFRIPSNLFRLGIAPLFIWYPMMTVMLYALAGLLIAVLHWIVPGKAAARTAPAETLAVRTDPLVQDEMPPLAKAA